MAGPAPIRQRPGVEPTLSSGGGGNTDLLPDEEIAAYELVRQRWKEAFPDLDESGLDLSVVEQQLLQAYPGDTELEKALGITKRGTGDTLTKQNIMPELRFVPQREFERFNTPHWQQRREMENEDMKRFLPPERGASLGAPVHKAQFLTPSQTAQPETGGRLTLGQIDQMLAPPGHAPVAGKPGAPEPPNTTTIPKSPRKKEGVISFRPDRS